MSQEINIHGDVYFGDVKGKIPHDIGKYTWPDGTVYDAKDIVDELECLVEDVRLALEAASGTLQDDNHDMDHVSPTSSEVAYRMSQEINIHGDVYFGDVKGKIPHDIGKYTWADGTVYDEFIRRPSIENTSELFEKVIKANNTHMMRLTLRLDMHTLLLGLKISTSVTKDIVDELECLVEDVRLALEAASGTLQDDNHDMGHVSPTSSEVKESSRKGQNWIITGQK
nr:hypothetical protein [Tanacetum cinerariifolium]